MKKGLLSRISLRKALFRLRGGVLTYQSLAKEKGRVLFSHDTTPFLNPHHPLDAHANYWTAVEMVRLFRERGYTVDVISNSNKTFTPKKRYAYFVDLEQNMDRIAPLLNTECVKILHIVAAHWLFQNTAEYERCLALQQRRGVSIMPKRATRPTHSIDVCDCATMIGNEFTAGTYAYAHKKIYSTPLPTSNEYPFPEEKNFDAARKNFIWFGGAGAVHKGLDLVIEAFAGMPEYHLTIFGKSTSDKDFLNVYGKELRECTNIKTLGYLENFSGEQFAQVRKETIGVVYPSCSEGTAGSAVLCMHAGILPIVSFQSGADLGGSGITLKESTVEAIREAVRTIGSLPADELKIRARAGWEHARKNYSRANFTAKYERFLDDLEAGKAVGAPTALYEK